MNVLVVNAGSSTMKLSVVDETDRVIGSRTLERTDGDVPDRALQAFLERTPEVDAVGHRVVHGGSRFTQSVLVDDGVVAALEELTPLAPLHQPAALAALDAARRVLGHRPHVACFDTAFHSTLPAPAATYALPSDWRENMGIRRFGFHGLAHAYAARRSQELLQRTATGIRMVTCHLGAGASLAAIRDGVSVDTTMGFTPLEGLVMATRSGSIDPGIVLWLVIEAGLSHEEVADALENHSGMLALTGSSDMREILDRSARGEDTARAALEVYVHRLCAHIGAMAASLEGIDALVFTGGVGQGAAPIRAAAAARLGFLGVSVDRDLNTYSSGDRDISPRDARVRTLVVESREDIEIARDTRALTSSRSR